MKNTEEIIIDPEAIEEVVENGNLALEKIYSGIEKLQAHIETANNMESKYISKKFDDVNDVARELGQLVESLETIVTDASQILEEYTEVDVYNKKTLAEN